MYWISLIIIFIFSLILAIRSAKHELSIPKEVLALKKKQTNIFGGVILFLRDKIQHYSSDSSDSSS